MSVLSSCDVWYFQAARLSTRKILSKKFTPQSLCSVEETSQELRENNNRYDLQRIILKKSWSTESWRGINGRDSKQKTSFCTQKIVTSGNGSPAAVEKNYPTSLSVFRLPSSHRGIGPSGPEAVFSSQSSDNVYSPISDI